VPSSQTEQRYHVTAEIEVRCPPGLEFKLEDVDLVKQGSFRDAEGPLDLTLGSTLGELRKLALASEPLHALVRKVEAEEDTTPAMIRLHASPRLLARMADAARVFPDEPTAEDLAGNHAWLRAALSFEEYEPGDLTLVEGEPAWRQFSP
jgi:hypothetical protein